MATENFRCLLRLFPFCNLILCSFQGSQGDVNVLITFTHNNPLKDAEAHKVWLARRMTLFATSPQVFLFLMSLAAILTVVWREMVFPRISILLPLSLF